MYVVFITVIIAPRRNGSRRVLPTWQNPKISSYVRVRVGQGSINCGANLGSAAIQPLAEPAITTTAAAVATTGLFRVGQP